MRFVGVVGRCRGVQPRSKTSMTIMRPPQHGQFGLPGSTAAAVVHYPLLGPGESAGARGRSPQTLARRLLI
jgi:hypothetical protein